MRDWLGDGRWHTHVIQPWIDGEPASLSVLCMGGMARLLSCNRQLIEVSEGELFYRGSKLNDMASHWRACEHIANRVAAVMPGLAAYIGIDAIIGEGAVTVLEINPRLTTSYAGLGQALGCNPAGLVLDLIYNGHMVEAEALQRNEVEVLLDE